MSKAVKYRYTSARNPVWQGAFSSLNWICPLCSVPDIDPRWDEFGCTHFLANYLAAGPLGCSMSIVVCIHPLNINDYRSPSVSSASPPTMASWTNHTHSMGPSTFVLHKTGILIVYIQLNFFYLVGQIVNWPWMVYLLPFQIFRFACITIWCNKFLKCQSMVGLLKTRFRKLLPKLVHDSGILWKKVVL